MYIHTHTQKDKSGNTQMCRKPLRYNAFLHNILKTQDRHRPVWKVRDFLMRSQVCMKKICSVQRAMVTKCALQECTS